MGSTLGAAGAELPTGGGFVPLFQTLAWILLIAGGIFFGRHQLGKLLDDVRLRVERDGTVKFTLGEFSTELARTAGDAAQLEQSPAGVSDVSKNDLEKQRGKIAGYQRGVHLAHIATPSGKPGHNYDIFVFLQAGVNREHYDGLPRDFSDVESIDFQVGPKFNPAE